jgi:hypothetical protein
LETDVEKIPSCVENMFENREEKRAISERELALNGEAGPLRRPAWRLVEATYGRWV